MTGDVVVHAQLVREAFNDSDRHEAKYQHLQVEAATYEAGREMIIANLPVGWTVTSWRVE